KPAMLPRADLIDDGQGHDGRREAIHDEAHHARRPARLAPLELNPDERVAGEKQRRADNLATLHGAALAQPRGIGFKAGLPKEMKRQPLTHGLQLSRAPIHCPPRLERALAATLEARLVPFPAPRHVLRLGMVE